MAATSVNQEIEGLRAEVQRLKAERETEAQMNSIPDDAAAAGETGAEDVGNENSGLEAQAEELFELLAQDLKKTNPLTLLAIFVLGLVFGRFLHK